MPATEPSADSDEVDQPVRVGDRRSPISQRRKSWMVEALRGGASAPSEVLLDAIPIWHLGQGLWLSTQQPGSSVWDTFRIRGQGIALCRNGSKLPFHRRHRMQCISWPTPSNPR